MDLYIIKYLGGNTMNVKPLKNHLLVKVNENEEATKSGIILVGAAKGDSNVAKIIEKADSFDNDQDVFLKGDRILISPHAGTKVKLDDEEYLIVSLKDVLAILR
ncbi:MAG: groES [Herbinix sp.]|jgi:chaperonin GroES|nr:groES [Herbinix sp.]